MPFAFFTVILVYENGLEKIGTSISVVGINHFHVVIVKTKLHKENDVLVSPSQSKVSTLVVDVWDDKSA